jgi:isochorismate synthase
MQALDANFQMLWKSQKPFVFFRTPDTEQIQLYFQEDSKTHFDLTFEKDGFVMRSFLETKKVYRIPAEHQLVFDIPTKKNRTVSTSVAIVNDPEKKEQKQAHKKLVQKALDTINAGVLKKVVLSQKITVAIPNPKWMSFFLNLIDSYPNALVYFWHHPETGTWLGATPERLLTVKGQDYQTMALAGTLAFNECKAPNWGEKEMQEQQFVVDAILKGLKDQLPKTAIHCSERYTRRAGNLLHLCTDIHFSHPSILLSELIQNLHPTPAVGGLPKAASLDFIQTHENYDRRFYSGVLGPIGSRVKEVFVNLRCGEIQNQQLNLYVGGGVTAASQVEKEWRELIRKSETLLCCL